MSLATRGTTEARLDEIHELLAQGLRTDLSVEQLMDAELDVEKRLCRADLELCELIRLANKQDKPVHLVSDTYYSATQLGRLLAMPEIADLKLAGIHSSSDYGVHKSGGLLKLVVAGTGVRPERAAHFGDNPTSDYKAARKAGCRPILYAKYSENLEEILAAEGLLPPRLSADSPVDLAAGDFGLTSLRSRALHRAELDAIPRTLRLPWATGAAVLGPVFAGFAEWSVRRAKQLGVRRISCLMREGEFLSRLFANPASEAGVDVSCLWASRQVFARANVFEGTADELSGFLHRRRPVTVNDLAGQLGFATGALPQLAAIADKPLDDPGAVKHVLSEIEASPEVRGQIVVSSSRLRERLLRYLDAQLPADGRVVLVDIGWGGTLQKLLQKLLDSTGRQVQTVGLYLGTNEGAREHMLSGLHMEGYLANVGEPQRLFAPVARAPEIIEQVCIPDLGSLVGFRLDEHGAVQPELAATFTPGAQTAQVMAVQAGILAFQRHWHGYAHSCSALPDLCAPRARVQLLTMLSRFVARPTLPESLNFGLWTHDENFGSAGSDRLIPDTFARRVPYLTPLDLEMTTMRDVYWPTGAARSLNPPLATLAGLVAEGHSSAADLSPPNTSGVIEVYVDNGQDFVNGPKDIVTPRSIRDGLSLVRSRLDARGVRRVRVDPAGRRSLFRIDWLRLTFHLRGHDRPHVVETADFRAPGFTVLGGRLVQPGTLEITSDDPQIVYSLDRARDASVTGLAETVEVEMAFASLMLAEPALDLPVATPPATQARRVARRLRSAVQHGRR